MRGSAATARREQDREASKSASACWATWAKRWWIPMRARFPSGRRTRRQRPRHRNPRNRKRPGRSRPPPPLSWFNRLTEVAVQIETSELVAELRRNEPELAPVENTPSEGGAGGDAAVTQRRRSTGTGDSDSAGGSAGRSASYAARLAAQLNRYKHYPMAARRARQEGTVTLLLVIRPDGSIADFSISGEFRLGRAGRGGAANAGPGATLAALSRIHERRVVSGQAARFFLAESPVRGNARRTECDTDGPAVGEICMTNKTPALAAALLAGTDFRRAGGRGY